MTDPLAGLFQEGEFVGAGVRWRYYRTGGAKPPLVLVHGWTTNARCWSELAAALAPDYDVIAYDARGHGRSDRLPAGVYPLSALAEDLIRLVQGLKLRRPGLLGHSMGAQTVMLAAALAPDLPAYLILEDPVWYQSAAQAQARRGSWGEWRAWVRSLGDKPDAQALAEYRAQSPAAWSELTLKLRLEAYRQMDLRVLTDVDWDAHWEDLVQAFRCPWLLLIGEPGRDGIVTPEQAEAALDLSPAGAWAQIPGAGHNVRFENFPAYLQAVRAFLERQPR